VSVKGKGPWQGSKGKGKVQGGRQSKVRARSKGKGKVQGVRVSGVRGYGKVRVSRGKQGEVEGKVQVRSRGEFDKAVDLVYLFT
jgi:hypothetical protein